MMDHQTLPTLRTALGLDPRATLGPAQAVNGPRVGPEDGTVTLAAPETTP